MMEDDGGVQEFQQKGQWEQFQAGLKLLRDPFPANQISKLPKPTKKQTEDVRADFKKGIRCQICGAWHHPDVIHLDYVGHAALTDRLLDADANWFWEPLAIGPNGLPVIDGDGGMWIKLTVCGITRLGYGDAQGKAGGDAMKERIGDALRNAAMRFGAALDLWHKGDLHIEEEPKVERKESSKPIGQACYESLDEGRKRYVDDTAQLVINAHLQSVATAKDVWAQQKPDVVEEQNAAWWKIPSNIRTAIKNHKVEYKPMPGDEVMDA
jgi:hypothetical protein